MGLEYLQDFPGSIQTIFLEQVKEAREKSWKNGYGRHYYNLLSSLPKVSCRTRIDEGRIQIIGEIPHKQKGVVYESAWQLKNWKKGPFDLFDVHIESEWRSDLKWNRLRKEVGPLDGQIVLDIGCNNGYFMYRMKESGAKVVLGIDPVIHFQAQFEFIQWFSQTPGLYYELFGIDEVMAFKEVFDTIFSMGVLYHHPHPLQQLQHIYEALKPGGKLVLETIGIPGEDPLALCPSGRYAKMKNIWFIPTLTTLVHWMEKSLFKKIKVISTQWQEEKEQRKTEWSSPVSYEDFLDPHNRKQTIEGYPSPQRFLVQAYR